MSRQKYARRVKGLQSRSKIARQVAEVVSEFVNVSDKQCLAWTSLSEQHRCRTELAALPHTRVGGSEEGPSSMRISTSWRSNAYPSRPGSQFWHMLLSVCRIIATIAVITYPLSLNVLCTYSPIVYIFLTLGIDVDHYAHYLLRRLLHY